MNLIKSLDANKAVNGEMKIDLVKLAGEKVWEVIYRCIKCLADKEELPMLMRIEKMVLLYKGAGEIYKLDNYRGIFLRHIILSLYQKWLYSKSAPVIDSNGTEYAFGGRADRSVQEELLIVKLIQDHMKWTDSTLYIKFMDVEKFFDTMNFKKALLDAYLSGLKGKAWNLYDVNNKCKTCVPLTPLGMSPVIEVNEVFVQGSTDAVLMAWNTMDCRNKKKRDMFDPVLVIEGVDILPLTFVDDLLEFLRNRTEVANSLVSDEIFEKESRFRFKPPKCKIMTNEQVDDQLNFSLDNSEVGVVEKHKQLGTIIAMDSREDDIEKRIRDAQGVMNEIVLICKSPELSTLRLKYVKLLMESCLCRKITFGCEIWDRLAPKHSNEFDDMKAKVIKRTMMLPYSTSSLAVKYEFGLIDLSVEVLLAKVLLTIKVLKSGEERIAKKLLVAMLKKNVPGYCRFVRNVCTEVFRMELEVILEYEGDVKSMLKRKIVEQQGNRLKELMLRASKTDRLLLNSFKFDGKAKAYLSQLPFEEAQMVFMVRTRMMLTKDNFPGRWEGVHCNVCGDLDTDVHLFACPGYSDLTKDLSFETFIKLDTTVEKLRQGATQMRLVNERLKIIQELDVKE